MNETPCAAKTFQSGEQNLQKFAINDTQRVKGNVPSIIKMQYQNYFMDHIQAELRFKNITVK